MQLCCNDATTRVETFLAVKKLILLLFWFPIKALNFVTFFLLKCNDGKASGQTNSYYREDKVTKGKLKLRGIEVLK